MPLLFQIGFVFSFCLAGEAIALFLPFAFPAGIISLCILLLCLLLGVLKVKHIEDVSQFLLSHMAFFFIPAGVGIIDRLDLFKGIMIPLILICVISTIITFLLTAAVVALVIRIQHFFQKKKIKPVDSDLDTTGDIFS